MPTPGHNPPLLFRRDSGDPGTDRIVCLDRGGTPIGISERSAYDHGEIVLQTDDVLVIFTDGITEANNTQEEEYGTERLTELVSKLRHQPASVIANRVLDEVTRFAGDQPQSDDITLMVLKVV